MNRFQIQCVDRAIGMQAGPAITGAGGMVQVCKKGQASKVSLFDQTGAAITNPVPLVRGGAKFYTANAAEVRVDLYIMAPDGQFAVLCAVDPQAVMEIPINRDNDWQVATIPFSIADSAAGVEKDTGFILPANAVVLPDVGALITVIETAGAKTMLAGLLSTQAGGVAAGYLNGISTAVLGLKLAQSAAGTTRGSFVGGATNDLAGSTDLQVAKNVSYTLVAASVAAQGFIILPYINLGTNQPTP